MADYFAGFGGASAAFMDDDAWRVRRFDNFNSDIEELTVLDILEAPVSGFPWQPDLAWFSPPCTAFSLAYNAPQAIAGRAGIDYAPDMSLVHRTAEIIKATEPLSWVVENVSGSQKWFKEYFGRPTQIIGPFVLYGNFPKLAMSRDFEHESKHLSSFTSEQYDEARAQIKAENDENMRARLRAIVPTELSQALKDSMELQQTIFDY